MNDAPSFAAALGRIPSGIFILTAGHGDDATGMLASWVQQCSFDPPLITLAVRRERHLAELLIIGAGLVVNIVTSGDTQLFRHFGKGFARGELAFQGIDVQRTPDGIPILTAAFAWLECRIANRLSAGDHDLIIAQVVAGNVQGDGTPHVHVRKSGLHY